MSKNLIQKAIEDVLAKGERAFVPYIMAGDGGLELLPERLQFLQQAGATAIEIGIPFSDPVADGPTIQQAGLRALRSGTTLRGVFEALKTIRQTVSIPLIMMTYYNPILSFGIEEFAAACQKTQINGVILPDVPIEEENEVRQVFKTRGISIIRLATLTSPLERLKKITQDSEGFLYAVTVKGVTGARGQFAEDVKHYLQRLKELSPVPVLAGFGISTPEQVREMGDYCDGVVVGSQIITLFENGEVEEIQRLIGSKVLNR